MKSVLYSTDENYLPHVAASLQSLVDSNGNGWHATVFASRLRASSRRRLERFGRQLGVRLEIQDFDEDGFSHLRVSHHFSLPTYYRLLAGEKLKGDRVLYLDADTIVTSSVDELWSAPLQDQFLAAVELEGFGRHGELGMRAESRYFSSGIMLINLQLWRQTGIGRAALRFAAENPSVLRWVDQCALNAVVDGRWVPVDEAFNVQTDVLRGNDVATQEARRSGRIIHFSGTSKPWEVGSKDPLAQLYWQARRKTPFRRSLRDQARASCFNLRVKGTAAARRVRLVTR